MTKHNEAARAAILDQECDLEEARYGWSDEDVRRDTAEWAESQRIHDEWMQAEDIASSRLRRVVMAPRSMEEYVRKAGYVVQHDSGNVLRGGTTRESFMVEGFDVEIETSPSGEVCIRAFGVEGAGWGGTELSPLTEVNNEDSWHESFTGRLFAAAEEQAMQ